MPTKNGRRKSLLEPDAAEGAFAGLLEEDEARGGERAPAGGAAKDDQVRGHGDGRNAEEEGRRGHARVSTRRERQPDGGGHQNEQIPPPSLEGAEQDFHAGPAQRRAQIRGRRTELTPAQHAQLAIPVLQHGFELANAGLECLGAGLQCSAVVAITHPVSLIRGATPRHSRRMASMGLVWNAELYEAKHAFVIQYRGELFEDYHCLRVVAVKPQ